MTSFELDFTWDSPGRVRGNELRATWGQLEIKVNDQVVTHVSDERARSTRDKIYGPLYPIAEWVATHWFFLFNEPFFYGKPGYAKRHNLRFASEGYALPDLEFRPEGEHINVTWNRFGPGNQSVRFLESGEDYLHKNALRDSFRTFLDATCQRLQQLQPDEETVLEREWRAIQELDEDERSYCRIAAKLGIDPFSTSDEEQKSIHGFAQRLPQALSEELASVTSLDNVERSSEWLASMISDPSGILINDDPFLALRQELQNPPSSVCFTKPPWEEGYARAREVRRALGLGDEPINGQIDEKRIRKSTAASLESTLPGVDAFVLVTGDGHAGVALRSRSDQNLRFHYARAVFEILYSQRESQTLVSRAIDERQKMNRAFAAELLAPHESIQARLPGPLIMQDDVDDLAKIFNVSSYLIQHQILNHRLAQIS